MVAKGGLGNETYLPVGADRAGDWCCLLALSQVVCLWAVWALRQRCRIHQPTGPGLPCWLKVVRKSGLGDEAYVCWLKAASESGLGDGAHWPICVGAAPCDAGTAIAASIALANSTKWRNRPGKAYKKYSALPLARCAGY